MWRAVTDAAAAESTLCVMLRIEVLQSVVHDGVVAGISTVCCRKPYCVLQEALLSADAQLVYKSLKPAASSDADVSY